MARGDNRYSLLVGWLKIALPLAALALLSTMFLFARSGGPVADLPFTEIAEAVGIANLRLAGVAEDGTVVTLSARSLRPPEAPARPDALVVQAPALTLTAPDGAEARMSAGTGEVDGPAQTLRLSGLVRLDATGGWQMETAGLRADLRAGWAESEGALEVRAPFGSLTAGALRVESRDGAQVLHFTQGVRLIYQP